jgi:hypothetical protein
MIMAAEPFPLISVSGTPYERGRQYGAAAAERIRRSSAMYSGTLNKLGLTDVEKTKLISGFLDQVAEFDGTYVEEMKGIADGAKVDLTEIVMINARTEVVAKAKLDKQVRAPSRPDDGCTGAVILPERSATGQIIHGQNWDWRAECVHTAIVLRVQRDDGPDFLTFVEAGGLARSGLNAAGISITANYLESDLDHQQVGVPLVCIRRKVLEQQHLANALRAVAATPKSCSNNMMVGSAEGFALDLECAPNEAFLMYPEDGLIAHANHFMSPVALSKLKDIGIKRFPDTLYRDWRVKELLKGRKLTIDDLKAALADDFARPLSVCRPPEPTPDGDLLATVATVILNPAEGYMEVAPLPAEGAAFTRYSLDAAEQAVAAE